MSYRSPKIDGAEFIRLRKQIEELRQLKEKKENLGRDLVSHEAHRRKLLYEWEDTKASEYREFQSAAKKVSRKLRNRVRVEVTMRGIVSHWNGYCVRWVAI